MPENYSIYYAELKRTGGGRREAVANIRAARENCVVETGKIASLSQTELVEEIRWARTWVLELLKLHTIEPLGPLAVPFLHEARDVIERVFYDPNVWKFALQMEKDPEGHEYQGAAEMCRDVGKYHQKVADTTGNPRQLWLASESFKEAVGLSRPATSANALATMELVSNERARGRVANFTDFLQAYETVQKLAPQAGGADRAIASSWFLVMESIYRLDLKNAKRGWEDYQRNIEGENLMRVVSGEKPIPRWRHPSTEIYRRLTGFSRRATLIFSREKEFAIRPEEEYFTRNS